jgi:hypothetical protein
MSFLEEVKRRKVLQIAAIYAAVAWLLVQVVDVVLLAWIGSTVTGKIFATMQHAERTVTPIQDLIDSLSAVFS